MRHPSFATSVVLTVAVLAFTACGDAPTDASLEKDVQLSATRAAPTSATGQQGGGAVVIRFSNPFFILVYDAETELLAAHMPSDVCASGNFNVLEVQQVQTPSDVVPFVSQVKSNEAQVAVYHAGSPAEAALASGIDFFGLADIVDVGQFCAFLAGDDRIAEGTVQRISTFSPASFHARWTGTIQGVDGRDYRLTEVYHLNADVHDPNNPDTFKQTVARVELRPER